MLKRGALPALVATSSLELGIDMGAVDLVIQIESPKSVAAGLQRVGRAGHSVGQASRGRFFPKWRGDLLETAVVTRRMREGEIEHTRVPRQPLDVLAQQVVAMAAMDEWAVGRHAPAGARAPIPTASCSQTQFEGVLEMLAGRYPSDEFAELRPRIVWDRVTGRHPRTRRRPPAGGDVGRHHPRPRPVRRVPGRLRRPRRRAGRGDGVRGPPGRGVPAGRDLVADRADHARPRAGVAGPRRAGKMPFWKGDGVGRPAELGRRWARPPGCAGSASWTSAPPPT